MEQKEQKRQEYAAIYGNAFVGILPLLVMFVGIFLCALTKNRSPICYWSAGVCAILLGFFLFKDKKEFSNTVIESIGNRVLCTILFALYFSGIMAKILSDGGLATGLVWLTSILRMPAYLIPLVTFVMGAIMSTATGTSLGTATALAPLMIPVAGTFGCSIPLTCGAVISGAVFGDNLAPVSDTTIASALTQQTEVGRVVRSRLKYSLIAGGISAVLFAVLGYTMSNHEMASAVVSNPADAKNLIFALVPILVIILMLKTGNLATALLMGDLLGFVLLILMGRLDYAGFVGTEGLIARGISGMTNVTVFIWFIFVVSGIVRKTGALDAMIEWLGTKATTARSAEIVCVTINAIIVTCIVSSASTCALCGAIERQLMMPYHVARDRTANLLDGMSCGVAGLLPYSSNALNTVNFALASGFVSETFSPLDIIPYNFHCILLVALFVFAAVSGWGRTYETDEQLAAEGIYIDPKISIPIPKGAKISTYKFKGVS